GALERVPGVPTASVSGLVNITADMPGTNNPYTFSVTYAVETGSFINASTVNNNNSAVRITGPNRFNKLATWVSSTPNTNSNTIVAAYKFDPHAVAGSPWVAADGGTYTDSMELTPVKTAVTTQYVQAGSIGTFIVGIPLPLTA